MTAFHERVRADCERAIPVGAYADDESAHYVFLRAGEVYAHTHAFAGERSLRALSPEAPVFACDEREMADDRSVRFDALPATPAVRGDGLMQIVAGPVHAGIIEPGRFTFTSGGETVVHLDAQLGFAHRGVERALESEPAQSAAPLVARICGSCSAARSYAYALALEELAGFEPEREISLARLIAAELERLYNHLADLAATAAGAAFGAGFAHGMALKERAMRIAGAAFGHRLLFDAIAPGGIGRAALENRAHTGAELSLLERDVRLYLSALFANASVVARWERTGIVTAELARAFGASGPAARASGQPADVRTLVPYGAYAAFPVAVAGATAGDVLARAQVKRDELDATFELLRLALAELRDTPLPPLRTLAPRAGVARRAVEGPRGIEFVAVHVDDGGRIERIHVISASTRNWPIVARAMENNIVPDFPLVNKSFNLCYACADR